MRDGLGPAASQNGLVPAATRDAKRVALSPLDLFSMEQRDRSLPLEFSSKRKICTVPFEFENIQPSSNDLLSSASINLMEEFVAFCKTKKANKVLQLREHPKKNLQEIHFDDGNQLKEKLVLLYGDYLPVEVCNLAWCKNVNEIMSTHGYSQNQIMVWKYPSMSKVSYKEEQLVYAGSKWSRHS